MADDSNPTLARTDEDRISERFIVEVVLNRRRRYALYYLFEHSVPVSVEDLAVQVAAWERATVSDGMADEVTTVEAAAAHVESVYAALRENHLPHLDGLGLVTYDDRNDRVTGRIEDPTVELYVTNDPRTTVAWYKVYLALTAVSTVLVGLTQVGVLPFGDLGPHAAAGLVVALFAVVSLAYWYDVHRWRRRNEDEPPDFLVSLGEEIPFEVCGEDGTIDRNGTNGVDGTGEEDWTNDENT